MGRPYYSRIAKQWHDITGYHGGPFKKYVLNDHLLEQISSIDNISIFELGAGNGYFMPKILRTFSGQRPPRIVITDLSGAILRIAETEFHLPEAAYLQLDIRKEFPFDDAAFDLIIATMVFNEVSSSGMKSALSECHRVLRDGSRIIATVTHPNFVQNLDKNGKLSKLGREFRTMPAKGALRVPVVIRSEDEYNNLFKKSGFTFDNQVLYPNQKILNERTGLRFSAGLPLALVYTCRKNNQIAGKAITNDKDQRRT